MRVVHIITCLEQGGAEGVLTRLVSSREEGWSYSVISLKGNGFYSEILRDHGIEPYVFNFGRFYQCKSLFEFARLVRLLNKISPDVVQTWLYHADLVGGVAARVAGTKIIIWGIRTASLSAKLNGSFTRFVAWTCSKVSARLPTAIISCSVEAVNEHVRMGYDSSKFHVIPNGYDLSLYFPNSLNRDRLRREWGVKDGEVVFGCIARWDPYKDHETLFRAISLVASCEPVLRCVLVGNGMEAKNQALADMLTRYDLWDSVILLGSCSDIPIIMNALDFHVLSSASEAFPNVVAEAMACGIPCVVTDVGDSAMIVDGTGWVVEPGSPQLLAQALLEAVNSVGGFDDKVRRVAATKRIEDKFSLDTMRQAYMNFWQLMVSGQSQKTCRKPVDE